MKTPILLLLASIGLMALLTASSPETVTRGHGKAPFTMQTNLPDLTPQVWPGMIVIKFKEGVALRDIPESPVITGIGSIDQKIASVEAGSLVKRFRHKPIPKDSGLPDISRIYRLTFPEKYDPIRVAALFSKDPGIEYAVPEARMKICAVPNDPMYSMQQHLPQVMAEQAWDIHKGENGSVPVKIAIVDTGVEWYHQDLWGNTWENLGEDADGDGTTVQLTLDGLVLDPGDINGIDDDGNGFTDDLIGWDFYNASQNGNGSNPDPNPGSSVGAHGTHCAGIATAMNDNGIGVAGLSWNLKYMALQTDINNNLPWAFDGIIYAADMGADVISNSWGGYLWNYDPMVADILAYASGKGSILVFAAGNDGDNRFFYPGCYPGVIGVASVNVDDIKVTYSNYGPGVDVCAPGGGLDGGILSTVTNNGYERYFGTSMATPLVAGLMGLVKSYHPEWDKEQVIAQVLATCDDIDALNPLYENQLGNGRINAYQALAMPGLTAPQELKLEMWDYTISDVVGDGVLQPGDTGTVSIRIRNYTHGVSSYNVHFILYTDDEQIDILNTDYVGAIDSDSIFNYEGIFRFAVSPDAVSHTVPLTLYVTADIPVVTGQQFTIPVTVAPSGFFVYEKYENGRDYSGTFIRQYLEDMGHDVTYSNHFPQSFRGYEAVFLSMGNLVFPNWDPGTFLTEQMMEAVMDYLESGGKVYLEGAGVFLIPSWAAYPNHPAFLHLFGINGASYSEKNPIDKLSGINGTLCQGMEFTVSSQYYNNWIEKIYPTSPIVCALEESIHGRVAIYNTGTYGPNTFYTFYLAYSLADLQDANKISSRYNLMNKVMEALGYPLPSEYMIANFKADRSAGGTSTPVTFTDLSLFSFGVTINSWQWDFQNDGVIDSYAQNPVFTFTEPGIYDVKLIVSDGVSSDTIIQKNFYAVNKGIMVYEPFEGCRDMSGAWMRDFLLENNYEVTYVNEVPRHINGYDALFLSFGSSSSYYSQFEDGFVRLLKDFLMKGGKVYLEGGSALGVDQFNTQAWGMFGLQTVGSGDLFTALDTIHGVAGSVCDGISFYGSDQMGQWFIDRYNPNATGQAAFNQPGYGNVAVQHTGLHGEKTFCFSYCLAELQDGESTREDVMWAILNYFDMVTGNFDLQKPSDGLNITVYPNPTRGSLQFAVRSSQEGHVTLKFYNVQGQEVATVLDKKLPAGEHTVRWDAGRLPVGIYFYQLRAKGVGQVGAGKIVKY